MDPCACLVDDLTVVAVTGTHNSMLTSPHTAGLAAALAPVLAPVLAPTDGR